MTDTPKVQRRKYGKRVPRSPLSPQYQSGDVKVDIGLEARSALAFMAQQQGVTMSEIVRRLVTQEGTAITLSPGLMDRINRNRPSSCTTTTYAEYLITDTLNQRGEA
jgi:hypothetical protein